MSEEPPDDLAPPIEALLGLPLQQETARERVAEPPGQRGDVDAVVVLQVNSLDPEQTSDEKEREGDACSRRDDDVGSISVQEAPREREIANQVKRVPRGGVIRPPDVLA